MLFNYISYILRLIEWFKQTYLYIFPRNREIILDQLSAFGMIYQVLILIDEISNNFLDFFVSKKSLTLFDCVNDKFAGPICVFTVNFVCQLLNLL